MQRFVGPKSMRASRSVLGPWWWLLVVGLVTLLSCVEATVEVELGSGPLTFTEGEAPISVDPFVTLAGTTNIATVTVAINHPVGTPQPQLDVLSVVVFNGITKAWDQTLFRLTLSFFEDTGTTAANFQLSLRTLTFVNTASDLSSNPRSLEYKVRPAPR